MSAYSIITTSDGIMKLGRMDRRDERRVALIDSSGVIMNATSRSST